MEDAIHNWSNQSFVLALTRIAEMGGGGASQRVPQPGFPGKMGPL